MGNEITIISNDDAENSITLYDSDAKEYARQAYESAQEALSARIDTLEAKDDAIIARLSAQESAEIFEGVSEEQQFISDKYNKLYFGEYCIEEDGEDVWYTYTGAVYDEDDNLLNHTYRVENGVDNNGDPIYLLDGNNDYVLEECVLYKIQNLPTIATSVSASSTNKETVGAKLFYDTLGDLATLINSL